MKIHVLVEGASEFAFLDPWLRRFLPHHTCKVIPHSGKGQLPVDPSQPPDPRRRGLLDQLPAKLRAFGKGLSPETDRFLVLVDLDQQDCMDLKSRLKSLLEACNPRPTVLFRIAIEETEAFYLGDRRAIRSAYPKAKLYKMDDYVQDSVCGSWELFAKVIDAKVEDKVGWAERMASHLRTDWQGKDANESPSFRHFCLAILLLAGESVD